jgi:hypothetical protein
MDSSKLEENYLSYIKFLIISPISTWWGAFTILVEILGFILINETITIGRAWLLILLFVFSTSLFVGVTVLIRGWIIFSKAQERIHVTQITRVDDDQYFILDCPSHFKIGSLLEVYRVTESVEVSIGFIEITHLRDDGSVQAQPLWITPIHLQAIENNEISENNLVIYSTFSSSTLPRWIDEKAESKLKELLRRGTE